MDPESESVPEPKCFRRLEIFPEPSEQTVANLLRIEETDNEEQWPRRGELCGLFSLYAPTEEDLETLQEDHQLDIIAIHGLGGDAYRTWQHENGFNWLEHLHEEFPGIRVFSYGYDAGIAFSTGTSGLTEYARHLLTVIKLTRSSASDKKRKIVFICHSMGGILLKHAYLLATSERGLYGAIRESVGAMLFFSTPHSSSASKYYADVLSEITETILFPTPVDKLIESFRTAILEPPLSHKRDMQQLSSNFEKEAYYLPQISSFIEKSSLPGKEDVLVDVVSGQVGSSRERVIFMRDHDHRQVCKHPSMTCAGMRMILSELKDVADREARQRKSSEPTLQLVRRPGALVVSALAQKPKNDALLREAAAGNYYAVNRFIKSGADVNVRNHKHQTALHLACQHGHVVLGLLLCDKDADVSAADSQGTQPLHLAVSRGESSLVMRIVENGGDPNAKDGQGNTSLHRAAKLGDEVLVQQLIEAGADCTIRNNSRELPVRVARKSCHFTAMRLLQLEAKGKQQALIHSVVTRADAGLLTSSEAHARYMAYNFPSVMTVNLDMDKSVEGRASILGDRAKRGDLETVEDLLDLGLTPTPEDLYLAAKECRSDVVEVLAGMMNVLDADVGWSGSALCAAACSSSGYNTLKILLEKGADVNWQGGKYGSALQSATANYRLENVKLLLQYGADANAQCGHYGNPLTAAARHRTNFEEMATLLLEHGADIDAQGPGEYGNPLQTAVYLSYAEHVKFFLQNGASKTMPGRFGSALDIAQREAYRYGGQEEAKEDILAMLTENEFVGFITHE